MLQCSQKPESGRAETGNPGHHLSPLRGATLFLHPGYMSPGSRSGGTGRFIYLSVFDMGRSVHNPLCHNKQPKHWLFQQS